MKKPFIMLMMSSCLLLTPSMAQVVVNDPVATSQAVITCGNARFTVLTPEMIRVEYSDQAKFEDEYAKFAPNGEIAGYEVLFSDYGSIIFYLDDFRYEVDPPYGVAHAMEEIAVPIAESILEQRTK